MSKGVIAKDMEAAAVVPSSYKFEKERQEESRLVKGVFEYRELKGGRVKFCFHKYAGDPVAWYEFIDGQEYEIPLAVVRHLNNLGHETHKYLLDSQGLPMKGCKKEHRFSFKSSEYF